MITTLGIMVLAGFGVWLGYAVGFKCGKQRGWNLARQLPCLRRIPH